MRRSYLYQAPVSAAAMLWLNASKILGKNMLSELYWATRPRQLLQRAGGPQYAGSSMFLPGKDV